MSTTDSYSEVSTSSDENTNLNSNIDFTGKLLNTYNIISELGSGAYSRVWLGYNIETDKFKAIKVQNPEDYKDGISEIKILKSLPDNRNLLKLNEYFVKKVGEKRFLCSSYDLCCGNLDGFIRKGEYKNGLAPKIAKNIFKQLMEGLKVIHKKCNLIHCDIKTDNILLKGVNNRDSKIIEKYRGYNFPEKYSEAKKKFWTDQGKDVSKIKKMKTEQKVKIRKIVHQTILGIIDQELNEDEKSDNRIDEKYMMNPDITIADFGAACTDDECYEEDFGTRYYRAPEVVLQGEVSNKVDIWAAGCILYELINGDFLFDPDKDKNKSRDYYHLLEMSKVSGKFQKKFLKTTKHWKKFFDRDCDLLDTEYREYYDWDELLDKVTDRKDREQISDLIKSMLSLNPSNRPSAEDVLKHPWLMDRDNSENISD